MFSQKVILNIHKLSLLVDPFESMATVTMVVGPSVRCPVITEEHDPRMVCFWGECQEIKERIIIKQKVLRIPRLGANHVWPLNGISTEKYGLSFELAATSPRRDPLRDME